MPAGRGKSPRKALRLPGARATNGPARQRNRLTQELLALFATKSSGKDYLAAAAEVIRRWSGFRCVGVRVADERGNIPYKASLGFSKSFLALENWINLRTDQCACIRVIAGTCEPQEKSLMTPYGSFHCRNARRFVPRLSARQRERYRGNCVRFGFASLVLVPIRCRGRTLGAIHLADERPSLAGLPAVQHLEAVAPLVGEALRRFNVEQALRRNYRALRATEENFRRIIETANEGIWVLDEHSRTSLANERMAGMLGYKASEMMGRPIFDFADEQWRQVAERHLQRRRQGIAEQHDFRFRHRDGGAVWAIVASTPIFDRAGRYAGALKMVTDITDRRRLEHQALNAGERERQRIGRDLHDSLGQSLTGLAFLVKSLEGKLAGRCPELAADASQIAQAANAATSQVQALARGLCPVEVKADGLTTALKDLAAQTSKAFGIRCTFSAAQPAPVHDRVAAGHVYQIVQEALHNAIKHGKAGTIQVSLRPKDRGAQLTIRDDGVGLPVHLTGKGLGLRTMRYRADIIGAALDIRGHPEGGTVVTCWLPAADHGPCPQPEPPRPAGPQPPQGSYQPQRPLAPADHRPVSAD